MVRSISLALLGLVITSANLSAQNASGAALVIGFDNSGRSVVSPDERALVKTTVAEVAHTVRTLFPTLADSINISVVIVDRDLSSVGGVAGRADAPGEVFIEISSTFPGGVVAAAQTGLSATLFHEFHHLVRGWTIAQNQFGPGIPTAMVNEGLASVFAETYSGTSFDLFDYPGNARDWLDEIMSLPSDADYNTWMNEHWDGRIAVGYRIGRFVVHEAMRRSGRSILELSTLSPEQILGLVIG